MSQESVIQSNNRTRQGSVTLPPLRNPPEFEEIDDLASLHYLNEPSGPYVTSSQPTMIYLMCKFNVVLHAIQSRYAQHRVYTYSGLALVAVNSFQRIEIYGPEYIRKYTDRKRGDLEPHLFAVAEDARLHMRAHGVGQTIIVSGDSGAGKTESAKLIMRFLASRTTGKQTGEAGEVERRMLATNPILEAFGNAKTVHNDNSSRFGKYLQVSRFRWMYVRFPSTQLNLLRLFLSERSFSIGTRASLEPKYEHISLNGLAWSSSLMLKEIFTFSISSLQVYRLRSVPTFG